MDTTASAARRRSRRLAVLAALAMLSGFSAAAGLLLELEALSPSTRMQAWTALALPSWSGPPRSAELELPRAHILLEAPEPGRPGSIDVQPARLPSAVLGELLEEQARRAGGELSLRSQSPLLARGALEDLARAESTIAALESAGARLALDIDVWLVPGAPGDLAFPGDGRGQGADSAALCVGAAAAELHATSAAGGLAVELARRHILSGDTLDVDRCGARAFLAGFDIEVATGAVSPVPRLGTVLDGLALRLQAWRWQRGTRVLLCGAFDLAVCGESTFFDPNAPDLGTVELPAVDVARIHFSGVIESGGMLRMGIHGGPRGPAGTDWTLCIRARAVADPARGLAPTPGAWQLFDWQALGLGGASDAQERLGLHDRVDPGFGLARPIQHLPVPPGSFAATAAWSEVEGALARAGGASSAPRPARPLVGLAPALVLMPATEEGAAALLAGLQSAAESARASTAEVRLTLGAARVWLPTLRDLPAAAWVGRERLALVGYSTVLAQEASSAEPLVEALFDGAQWAGAWNGAELVGSGWLAATTALAVVERNDAVQGRLQLPLRSLRTERLDARVGRPAGLEFAPAGDASRTGRLDAGLAAAVSVAAAGDG